MGRRMVRKRLYDIQYKHPMPPMPRHFVLKYDGKIDGFKIWVVLDVMRKDEYGRKKKNI